jgi:lycopene beta-cyclase
LTNSQNIYCDYVFVGSGAGNILVINQLKQSGLLTNKKIVVIEPLQKNTNDRTFCFWASTIEVKKLGLENLVTKYWDKLKVNNNEAEDIAPTKYCYINALDLYNQNKTHLATENVVYINKALSKSPIKENEHFIVEVGNQKIFSQYVFDNRPEKYTEPKQNEATLIQSFTGINISTTHYTFNSNEATLMDFNVPQAGATQFMYLLPFTEHNALVELTRFGSDYINSENAKQVIECYLQEKNIDYTINDYEHGAIPMSSAALEPYEPTEGMFKTGKAAGMLKPSTGYAFLAMAQHAVKIKNSLSENAAKAMPLKKITRFSFYDRLLLKILQQNPDRGKEVFEALFKHNSVTNVVQFLLEKTKLPSEVAIFSKLPILLFLKYALLDVGYKIRQTNAPVMPIFFSIILVVLQYFGATTLQWIIVALGFIAIGIPHGAVDHVAEAVTIRQGKIVKFIVQYLAISACIMAVWWLLPNIGLVAFVAYSAWHFGQADFGEWEILKGSKVSALLWGIVVLGIVLCTHCTEVAQVLQYMNATYFASIFTSLANGSNFWCVGALSGLGLFLALRHRSIAILLTIGYLLVACVLPLILSFSLYFIFQHSFNGWRFLQKKLQQSSVQLWKQGLPFSIPAILFVIGMLILISKQAEFFGLFFIFLSSISLPHILIMDKLYQRR